MTEFSTSKQKSQSIPDTSTPSAPVSISAVIDQLLARVFWVVITLGLFATAATLNRWVQTGWHIQHLVHLTVFILLLVGVGSQQHLSRQTRIAFILSALGINGTANLIWHGLAGTGPIFMAIVCIMTSVLVSFRMAWITLFLFCSIIGIVGTLTCTQVLPVVTDPEIRLRSWTEWLAQGMAFLATVTGGIVSVAAIQSALLRSSSRLQQRTVELEQEIKERQRVEEQLRQSEKLQAIGRLAGGIAHDFNNQLAGVIGYAELLKRENTDDAHICNAADNILKPAYHATDLTSKLLAFARKGHYRSEPVNLHEIVNEVVAILQRSIDKTVTIYQELNAVNCTVKGDPTLLQSAIMNVSLNSRDAMPTGGILNFITLNSVDQKGERIVLKISDTGVGMDDEVKGHIFEPFFTTKPAGHGTGMGLAAVHGTVQSHDGEVTVDSSPGEGSTFYISFPVSKQSSSKTKSTEKEGVVGGTGRILVVDDELSVLNMTTEMLEELGYIVTPCSRAGEALRIFNATWQEIDLVLLDMVLPDITGKMVFTTMRRIHPEARIILFSGFTSEDDANELLDHGASGFIHKPFSFAKLSTTVAQALQRDM